MSGCRSAVVAAPVRWLALLIGLAAALAMPTAATAAEIRSGGTLTVPDTELIDDDAYLFGGTVDIDGRVDGDAIVSAGELTVTGGIVGSLNAAVGRANLEGSIGRSVRIAGGEIVITGIITGDLLIAGGMVTIEPGAEVGGDLIATGGDVDVGGNVGGEVRGTFGDLEIGGAVDGDVDVTAGQVRVLSNAVIGGALAYTSQEEAQIAPSATIGGPIDRDTPERFGWGDSAPGWTGGPLLRLLWQLVAGVILVLLMPRATLAVASAVRRRPLPSLLIGLLALVLIPIVAVLLLITVVGIPVGVILLIVYGLVLYLSQVFVGLALGRLILPDSWDDGGRGYNLLAVTLGIILLAAIRLIPVPLLPSIAAAIVALLGLGAVLVSVWRGRAPGTRRHQLA